MSKVKLMAATLAIMTFSAVPAVAQDTSAEGGDAVNFTGDATSGSIDQNINQNNEDINQNAEISAGGSNGDQSDSENNIDQNVSNEASQYAETGDANTGGNIAVGGDASAGEDGWYSSFFDWFSGFFGSLFG